VGYFQFVYLPATQVEEEVPLEWLNPAGNGSVQIVPGAALQTQAENFVPAEILVVLGVNNTVFWRNNDTASHTVTSGTFQSPGGSADRAFDATASRSNFLRPKGEDEPFGGEFAFTFARPGLYVYHCQPHPWMQGRVVVVPPLEAPGAETSTAPADGATSLGVTAAPSGLLVSLALVALPVAQPEW
jgi:plastocyanin